MTVPIDHRAGTQVGPFVLGNVVGQGGMGIVYSATRSDTGEIVALKLMNPDLAASDEFRQRFLNEAAVGPIMDHPNVVPIYGSGEAGGELYISMKLIEGRNLKEILKGEGTLEPKRALKIFRQVASALDAAHESGMVHRDVKPQNILIAVDDDGHDLAYVSDFGLVKPMSSETTASRTGQVFGSLPYMAPEQIEAMEMDGRADVYALACVLFESLTGRPPFERPNEVAVVWAHVHEEPPLVTDMRKELPGGVDGVVMQALSKHPDDRYLTCGEFVEAFEQGLGRQRSRVSRAMRPLVARTPRPKTEREVWGPNFFPELSRIRKVQRDINWVQLAAFVGGLFLIASVQVGREGGIPKAAGDLAREVGSIGRTIVDDLTGVEDPPSQEETIGPEAREIVPPRNDPRRSESDATVPIGRTQVKVEDKGSTILVTGPAVPKEGTYWFEQTGWKEYLGARRDLPQTMIQEIAHERAERGTLVVVEGEHSDYSSSTRMRYRDDKILVTQSGSEYYESSTRLTFNLFYTPRPPIELLRYPVRDGASLSGRWAGQNPGEYSVQVEGTAWLDVAGERIETVEVATRIDVTGGSYPGWAEVTYWIDPRTNIAVKAVGAREHTGDAPGAYLVEFEALLRAGPGY